MKTYSNYIKINGQQFTHTIEAFSYKEALEINKQRKVTVLRNGRKIYGHLQLIDNN